MTETNILKKDIQKAIKEFKKDNCPNLNLPKHKLMKIADDNNITIKPTGKIKQDPYKVFPPSPLKGTKKKTTKPKSKLSEIQEATKQIKEATDKKLKDMKKKKPKKVPPQTNQTITERKPSYTMEKTLNPEFRKVRIEDMGKPNAFAKGEPVYQRRKKRN